MKSPFTLPIIRDALAASPLVVIDVGARGGVVAPWAQPGAGPLVRTYGFEPNPADFQALQSTAERTYYQMAISDSPGRATFYARAGVGSLGQRTDREWTGESYEQIEVEVETLENLARRGLIDGPDVIKTDAERYDLRAVRSAGPLLDDVLAVVCEFEFYNTPHDNSFSSIDKLLCSHGMMLFGLSLKNGPLGEVGGGDLLYVRDVGTLLSRAMPASEKRAKFLKLFAILAILKNVRYAALLPALAQREGILGDAEAAQLRNFVNDSVFLPFAMPDGGKRLRSRLAHVFSLLGQVILGRQAGVKSAPSPNMFTSYTKSFVNRRWLPRSFAERHREMTDKVAGWHAGLEGVYYAPTSPKSEKAPERPAA